MTTEWNAVNGRSIEFSESRGPDPPWTDPGRPVEPSGRGFLILLIDIASSNGAGSSSRNPFAELIKQSVAKLPSFTLESGVTLTDVPVAYKTWGQLNKRGDNCLVICHALTGSSDVEDW